MAVKSTTVTVTTTATLIPAAADAITGPTRTEILVQNLGTGAIYVGASDVTTANGIQVNAGASLGLNGVATPDALYAITASGTQDVRVLEIG